MLVVDNDISDSLKSIEAYDPTIKEWSNAGNFLQNNWVSDAVVLKDKVYIIAGHLMVHHTPITKSTPPI